MIGKTLAHYEITSQISEQLIWLEEIKQLVLVN